MKICRCPKCGKPGSLHMRWATKRKYPYYYVAHYVDGKIELCYVPTETAKELIKNLCLLDKEPKTVKVAQGRYAHLGEEHRVLA